MWLPLMKIFEICSAVFTFYSLKAILAFHKYYITSLSPVFHTGILGVDSIKGDESMPWQKKGGGYVEKQRLG